MNESVGGVLVCSVAELEARGNCTMNDLLDRKFALEEDRLCCDLGNLTYSGT